jgi:tRNA-specific 2-thiouridylase
MEICFVPDNDYGRFLEQSRLVQRHAGEIVDTDGRVLGRHDGIEFYTIGQRKGLGISAAQPLYVLELDPATNRVVVGDESKLNRSTFSVDHCNWIPWDSPPDSFEAMAKIRYNHAGAPATVEPLPDGTARVRLHTPARAVTPGQACVFYDGDRVLGGGWIRREPGNREEAHQVVHQAGTERTR